MSGLPPKTSAKSSCCSTSRTSEARQASRSDEIAVHLVCFAASSCGFRKGLRNVTSLMKSAGACRGEPSLRDFLKSVEDADPRSVVRIRDGVSTEFDITAVAMELEARGEAPILIFENVRGYDFPVV